MRLLRKLWLKRAGMGRIMADNMADAKLEETQGDYGSWLAVKATWPDGWSHAVRSSLDGRSEDLARQSCMRKLSDWRKRKDG